jgi:peptide subunit release factor 1 (eRF1)
MFDRIEKFIEEKGIKPSDCSYHTLRTLENNGKIRVLVLKGENIARCEYICPKCGHYAYCEKEWKRPFSVKCEKCGATIKVPRLLSEIKKKKKV